MEDVNSWVGTWVLNLLIKYWTIFFIWSYTCCFLFIIFFLLRENSGLNNANELFWNKNKLNNFKLYEPLRLWDGNWITIQSSKIVSEYIELLLAVILENKFTDLIEKPKRLMFWQYLVFWYIFMQYNTLNVVSYHESL